MHLKLSAAEMQLMEVAPLSADGSDVEHYTGRLTHHRQLERAINREEARAHVMLGVFSGEATIKGSVHIYIHIFFFLNRYQNFNTLQ